MMARIPRMILICIPAVLLAVCCCTLKPAPPVAPRVTAAVLCAGDSLMAGFGPAIEKKFSKSIRFIQAGKVSSGLCNRKFYDWNSELRRYLEKYHPAVVLICLSTNDTMNISDGKKSYRFFSDGWKKLYRERVEALIADAREYGAELLWIAPPVMGRADLENGLRPLCSFIEQICREHGVRVIDLYPVLSAPGGKYLRTGYINGRTIELRYKDGIHITPAGNELIVRTIKPVLAGSLRRLGKLS